MSKQQLLELAERVEGLSGPCRDVDALIKEAFGHSWDYAADWGPRGSDRPVAYPYTASLDSAMTLVQEGRDWMVDNFDGPHDRRCSASVFNKPVALYQDFEGFSTTPALALTAASLRAKAAMIEAGERNASGPVAKLMRLLDDGRIGAEA